MGFLSFLSRKSLADKPQGDGLLITQAYHSTKAATAPVRGKYPVGGNGKTDLETLAKARGLNHAQSLGLLRPDDGAAPAPPVPLYRSDSAGRPSSAPNATFTAAPASRSKRTFAGSLGVASRRQSVISESRPTSSATSLQSGSGESKLRAQSISSYQQRLPSISSSGSGHKDILDAQSELKPSDFKSRVRATGARDFGEDVADRNIQENGCNVDSPAVQAFYRQDLYDDALRKPGSLANVSRPYRRDSSLQKPTSVQSGLRTVSLNSPVSRNNSLKRRASSRLSQASGIRASVPEEHLDKRPRSSGPISRRQSLNRKRRSELGRVSSIRSQASSLVHQKGGSSPGSPMRLATHFPELLADSDVPSSPELRLRSPTTRPGFAATSSSSTIRPPSERKVRSEILPSTWTDDKPAEKGRPSGQRAFPLVDASKETPKRGSSAVLSTKALVTELSPPPTPPPMERSSLSSAGYHTANSSLSYPSSHHSKPSITGPLGHFTISTSDPSRDTESAPSPSVKIAPNPMDEFGTVPDIRTRHLPSSLRKLQLDDFRASQAPHSSSLHNQSISSPTPTSSDTSSYSHQSTPLQRPVSRHTAQTSVDLDPRSTLTKHSNTSQDSFISQGQSPATSSAVPPVPTVAFNMDDYISSDDDSLEPQRPRGQDETELLFSDTGYGEGFQLPGLFDALAVTPPPQPLPNGDDRPTRPGSSRGLPPDYGRRMNGYQTSLYSSPTVSVNRNRFTLTTGADSEDEDDDWSPEEMGYTAQPGLSPSSPGRGMRRLPALGGVPLEQEQVDKLSAQDAIRMRKEAKARKRASGFGIKTREWPQKGKGKEVECNDENRSEVQS